MIVDKDGAESSPEMEAKETAISPEKELQIAQELQVAEEYKSDQQIQTAIEKTEIIA